MSVSFLDKSCEQSRPDWAAPVAAELNRVERTLEAVMSSDVSPAFQISMQLLTAGGKRIRPALVVLAAMASGECDLTRVVNIAAASELIHMASLLHDDVLDETCERRGARTANDSWGNKISVLGGDYLLSRSFQLLAANGGPEVFRLLSTTAVRMTESEILQASSEGDLSAWEANYWRIIKDKTAEFLGSCCECGAILSGADAATRQALREYGVQLGIAFQITDDVLDIAGDPALTGKPVGADLSNGKFTLPVLLALRDWDKAQSLRVLLTAGALAEREAGRAAAMVMESGAVDTARKMALECACKAREQLDVVPDSDYTQALAALAAFVIDRQA